MLIIYLYIYYIFIYILSVQLFILVYEHGIRGWGVINSHSRRHQQAGQGEVTLPPTTCTQPCWLVSTFNVHIPERWCSACWFPMYHRYPWGQEAFDKARNEDKPIFLSGERHSELTGVLCKSRNVFSNSAPLWPPVGYSTCHWCHVMERESFEDEEIGKILSDNFVCIKLDREERPDVDKVYMTFIQVWAFFMVLLYLVILLGA